ncbi:glycosyltransferase family 9 protein [Geovibrio thiophilus]|uniref:Glycosyltransferase family 9 protein n=1 Tax=Geovibrio thiophilus TaxID=139438 RepID=A0A3R5UWC7_9BACT|nr:glycosyltransferase family 9 protein [Geovibrio thiophilus]QAR34303.1 glycosyltransferase family 9 protein [Geovibrio thiophilus]
MKEKNIRKAPVKNSRTRVLFVRLSSLGDVILITGVIKRFSEQFPDYLCDVFTSAVFAPVFDGLDFVNRVITFDKKDGFKGFAKAVQEELNGYDYVIDLHANLRTFLLRFMADAKFLKYHKDSAARRMFVKSRKRTERLGIHVVEKYAETLKPLGMKEYSVEELRPVLHSGRREEGCIVLNPFASKLTKQWDKFPELAERLVDMGQRVTVIGQGDFPQIDGVNNLTGKTTLREMLDIIAASSVLITTDSGPMHAGVALNKKVIAVFGSTTSDFGFAPEFKGCSVVEVSGLGCRPCHVHGQDKCPQEHFRCMRDISVDDVLELL